jgi:diacylglycerol kinase (ATP)
VTVPPSDPVAPSAHQPSNPRTIEPSHPTVVAIINPISGTGGRPHAARRRAELAASIFERRGISAEIIVTEGAGHARELSAAAVARGVRTIIAWGGDGTVNEVASAVAFSESALAIVPTGSGNGLARELGVPFDARRAIDAALDGGERRMDVGELDGRLFFNVAGIGLDARIAHQFAKTGLVRRGLRRYAEITLSELFMFEPDDHTVATDDATVRVRALLIAIANARQYGHGAVIAPGARIDDGRLDVVIVNHRSIAATLVQLPRLFAGRVMSVPGVTVTSTAEVEVTSAGRVLYHVDGEPFVGGVSLKARVFPAALKIRVPALAGSR